MRYRPLFLFLPLTVLGAAEDGLANLTYLNDRLELHPRVAVGGRYDSNINAAADDPQDEIAAIGTVGAGLKYAWSEVTTVTADVDAQLVVTDQPEQRYRNQGQANVAILRRTDGKFLAAHAAFGRTDDPDMETGERLLVDHWSGDVGGDFTGLTNRISTSLGFNRSDYLENSRSFQADDRDQNTIMATIGYGLRLDGGDELTLRVVGDRLTYDASTTTQDNTGVSTFLGWNRQVSEKINLSIEAGVEYRHYDASNTIPQNDLVSPTWQVNGRTVNADESTWSLTLSGGLQDTVSGSQALQSRLNLNYGRPLNTAWSVNLGVEGFNLQDVYTVGSQPKDQRWTVRGMAGTNYSFRPGLSGNINGGYEYSSSDLQGDYDRVFAQAGITARF